MRRGGAAFAAAIVVAVSWASWTGAAPDRLADLQTVIGVVPQRELDPGEADRIADAGIDSIRVFVSWAEVEPVRGRYDWSNPDAWVTQAAEAGLRTFPFLYTEPKWATEFDYGDCSESCSTYAPASAPTRGAYAQFAAAAAERYGPGGTFWYRHPELPYLPVHSWQIWNEQNSPGFFRPRPDVHLYAAMLDRASTEIRAVDPGAEIVLGGMFSADDRPSGVVGASHYLRDLYRLPDVERSFDAIAVHPYDAHIKGTLDQVRAVRRVARRAGDGAAGTWVTELGWASAGRHGQALVKDRAGQARMLTGTFGRLLRDQARLHLRGIYWFAWRDSERGDIVCTWCPHAGLLDRAGRPKPAYKAMRGLALGR